MFWHNSLFWSTQYISAPSPLHTLNLLTGTYLSYQRRPMYCTPCRLKPHSIDSTAFCSWIFNHPFPRPLVSKGSHNMAVYNWTGRAVYRCLFKSKLDYSRDISWGFNTPPRTDTRFPRWLMLTWTISVYMPPQFVTQSTDCTHDDVPHPQPLHTTSCSSLTFGTTHERIYPTSTLA